MTLRIVGRVFIAAGVFILLFVAYQVFGTNLVTSRHQTALAADFEKQQSLPPPTTLEAPDLGAGLALMTISKIGLEQIVVEGVGVETLKKGPGHYPGTALPGETGNFVVSGHRTTYGAPFYRLDELSKGDTIVVLDRRGSYTYAVTETKIVKPTDLSVITTSDQARLTLTTCHPRFSARERLIVVADLTGVPVPVVQ